MKYVLLFTGTMEEQEAWDQHTREQMLAAYAKVGQWFDEHVKAGTIVGAHELQGPSTATTVRFNQGKAIVTDGPYIEAKEIIGGFAIIDVKDLDAALALAKTWPGGSSVEVRPIVDHSAD
jgi:hypothetical protein